MAQPKAVLENRYSNKYKGFQLLIRIQYTSKKRKDIRLGIYLPKIELFDKDSQTVKKNKIVDYLEINKIILNKKAELQEADSIFSSEEEKKLDLILEIERNIEFLQVKQTVNTERFYYYTNKHLKDYFNTINKDAKLSIKDIDDMFLDSFQIYLIKTYDMKKATIKGLFSIITTVFNIINKRYKLKLDNPLKGYEIKGAKKTEKQIQIRDFRYFEVHIPKSPPRIMYKHYCLFQFYSQGSRISDIISLRFSNILLDDGDNDGEYRSIEKILENFDNYINNKYDIPLNFILEFKAVKTDNLHSMILHDYAIMNLRFFLDRDLQDIFLYGIEDDELRKYLKLPLEECKDLVYTKESIIKMKKLLRIQLNRPDRNIFHDTDISKLSKKQKLQLIATKTSNVNKSLKTIAKEDPHLLRFSSHDFRHIFSISYYTKTSDLFGLSKLLYHYNVSITERYLQKINCKLFSQKKIKDFYNDFTKI